MADNIPDPLTQAKIEETNRKAQEQFEADRAYYEQVRGGNRNYPLTLMTPQPPQNGDTDYRENVSNAIHYIFETKGKRDAQEDSFLCLTAGKERTGDEIPQFLWDAFQDMDQQIPLTGNPGSVGQGNGSTANVAYIPKGENAVYCANTGDSRSVLLSLKKDGSVSVVRRLSRDHRFYNLANTSTTTQYTEAADRGAVPLGQYFGDGTTTDMENLHAVALPRAFGEVHPEI